ncbi:MAG TPA: glycosyltransferase family 2 protein [Gemmatimonadaceae bacterium]|nr:glycosyltransferase family 2 protein [Gemmatimonadaceae bacterium]
MKPADTSSWSDADLDTTRWSVVIPSFNHADDAVNCLASLREAHSRPERVILVDDASTDDAVTTIADWVAQSGESHAVVEPGELETREGARAWLTIVASKTNSGFAASCNIGLRFVRDHTDAPFALLLNNDAAVAPSYFPDMAAGIRTVHNVGLATGTIYEWDRRTVWYAGGRFNPLRAVAEHFLAVPTDGQPRSTGFICGCTMLISRAVLERVGLLPELYSPCYCEDADYSLKVAASGFELLYVPDAKAFHRVSSSLGREIRSPQVIYWFNRNRGYAMRRNYSGWRRAGGIAYLALTKPARALWEVLRGRPRSGSAFIRGTLAGLFDPVANDDSKSEARARG